MPASGQYNFAPDIASTVATAYSRIQVRRAAITIEHMADARIALNLILADYGALRGVNLAQVDQISYGLPPGLATIILPANTVDLLDTYLRTCTPSTTTVNLGNPLTALVDQTGAPIIGIPYGDPIISAPGGGVLSCVAGSPVITMKWPAHGLTQTSPIFFGTPVTVGGVTLGPLQLVSNVIDGNTFQFTLPYPVLETMNNQGGTPLFYAQSGSSTITVVQPGHGMQPGQTFTIPASLVVGGLMLSGIYTVSAVQSLYQFTFTAASAASSTGVAFENGGQLNLAQQAAGVMYSDVPLFPLSRNDYSAISNKYVPGRPTSYWVDRVVPPTVSFYPVANNTAQWAFVAYRMREIQDANPVGGQTFDAPKRMLPVVTAELTAWLAEIWKPEMWQEKQQAAEKAWMRFQSADAERVSTYIRPQFQSYYR